MSSQEFSRNKLLVVRGDLRSNTGYARALRDLCKLLVPRFEATVGSDIHYHPGISTEKVPFSIINDSEIEKYITKFDGEALVLHFTTPDRFLKFRGAKNVGYFFWETDRFTAESNWLNKIQLMDELWLPSEFQKNLISKLGFEGQIHIITWPQSHDEKVQCLEQELTLWSFQRRKALSKILVKRFGFFIGRNRAKLLNRKIFTFKKVSLDYLVKHYPERVLTIAQNVPRKGLILQLSEWCDYLFENPGFKGCLILKTSSLNVNQTPQEQEDELAESLFQICQSRSIENPHVYVITNRITEPELEALYSASTLYSTHSFGEGFGGPVVEAIYRSRLVISPRHTALGSFIPENYQLGMKSSFISTGFVGQLSCYSVSSHWGIPHEGEWKRCFTSYLKMTPAEKAMLVKELQSTVDKFCSPKSVNNALDSALSEVVAK